MLLPARTGGKNCHGGGCCTPRHVATAESDSARSDAHPCVSQCRCTAAHAARQPSSDCVAFTSRKHTASRLAPGDQVAGPSSWRAAPSCHSTSRSTAARLSHAGLGTPQSSTMYFCSAARYSGPRKRRTSSHRALSRTATSTALAAICNRPLSCAAADDAATYSRRLRATSDGAADGASDAASQHSAAASGASCTGAAVCTLVVKARATGSPLASPATRRSRCGSAPAASRPSCPPARAASRTARTERELLGAACDAAMHLVCAATAHRVAPALAQPARGRGSEVQAVEAQKARESSDAVHSQRRRCCSEQVHSGSPLRECPDCSPVHFPRRVCVSPTSQGGGESSIGNVSDTAPQVW